MNKGIEILVLALGGLSLFVVAFLGFAAMSGKPLSRLTVLGRLFPEPLAEQAPAEPEERREPESAYTPGQVIEANVGMLSAYTLDPPFSADELQALVVELKGSKIAYEKRLADLQRREADLGHREELVRHQHETLEQMRSELDRLEAELSLRSAELRRDQDAVSRGEESRWVGISTLFEAGDVDDHSKRLVTYEPDEASRILANLSEDRAAALLNAIGDGERWKEYADAYSRRISARPGGRP